MNRALVAAGIVCSVMVMDFPVAGAQPFPSAGSPNPAMTGLPASAPPASAPNAAPAAAQTSAAPAPAPMPAPVASAPDAAPPSGATPRAVTVARATAIPRCALFVDAAANGNGSAQSPYKTISAAVAAAPPGAVICVAEGTYSEQLKPGEKYFTLAGGFQRGTNFTVRDSARYVSKAQGRGGSFFRAEDPAPKEGELTAIDGFEISGYAQAVVRDVHYSQRFDLTNNHIHDNRCDNKLAGAGVAFNNISGRVQGNVFRRNFCGRGGALFIQDTEQKNNVVIANNLVDDNHGMEPGAAHGGAFYLFGKAITITGNLFTNNSVTQWGGGLYVGAWTEGKNFTTANLSWNIYRGNRAGNGGGGFFCDDGASCTSEHEIYDRNCGGNILLDGGDDTGSTIARFTYMTNVGALEPGCGVPGPGVRIDKSAGAPDSYSFTNSLFWGNAPGKDFAIACDAKCGAQKVNISHSMVQTNHANYGNVRVGFGPGIVTPSDPLFAAPEQGDFHLKSTAGRWAPGGYVQDAAMSPAIAKADPNGGANQNPERAGRRNELGAYGNSAEASYVR